MGEKVNTEVATTKLNLSISEIEKMLKYYRKAYSILEKMQKVIAKLLEDYDDELAFREDSFEPLWMIKENELMRWNTGKMCCLVVKKDGSVAYLSKEDRWQ